MHCAQSTLPPCKLLARLMPLAALTSPMSLTKVCASLRTLRASLKPAPLTTTMPHTTSGPAASTPGAPGNCTSLPPSMSNTIVSPSMDALRANSTAFKKATLTSTMTLAEWRASLCSLSASLKHTTLATSMGFAEDCAPLGPLGALSILTPSAASMGNAKSCLTLSTPIAAISCAAFTPTMPDA
ncbi:hypothetical protein KFK09_025499 [Dendrobium nobile]|uniref:Uncharacterized protein n=1 Tax=Dendrobium nobile TaxID=94219 RepID=A0A8T3AGJ3_DENNO|nr:hypothetical protein KFK09_025499 [Dendrobium nobile]